MNKAKLEEFKELLQKHEDELGVAMVPLSVLDTFPEAKRLSVHPLPKGKDVLRTYLFWRKGALSPKISALIDVLGEVPA